MKCLGGERASATENDAAVRIFSGYPKSDLAAEWNVGSVGLRQVQKALAETLLAAGRCRGERWLIESVLLPHTGLEAFLLRDVVDDEWLCVSRVKEEVVARAWELRSGRPPVFSPPSQVGRPPWPPANDLAWFSLAGWLPEIDPEFDLTWTLVARAILKHFARRLAGLDCSSPGYLYRNFFAGTGFVRDSGERIEVELARSDLNIVLRIAGIFQETYALPWIEKKDICLLPSTE
jgi:hypothetical protein